MIDPLIDPLIALSLLALVTKIERVSSARVKVRGPELCQVEVRGQYAYLKSIGPQNECRPSLRE